MKMHKPPIQQRMHQQQSRMHVMSANDKQRAGESVYRTERWKQLSASMRKTGVCAVCGATQKQRRLYLDHVREIKDGGDPFSPSNLQILCARHHVIKTRTAAAERGAAEGGGAV